MSLSVMFWWQFKLCCPESIQRRYPLCNLVGGEQKWPVNRSIWLHCSDDWPNHSCQINAGYDCVPDCHTAHIISSLLSWKKDWLLYWWEDERWTHILKNLMMLPFLMLFQIRLGMRGASFSVLLWKALVAWSKQ